MSKRCAHCAELNPRRSKKLSSAWVGHLEAEHGVSPVGTLVMPLCRACYAQARDLPADEVTDGVVAFLAESDAGALVDEVAG